MAWIVIESKISKDEMHKGNKTSDYGTCELYAIGQAGVFLSALWFPAAWEYPNLFHFIGFITFLCVIAYRLWAIKTLGKYYSHIVREVDAHKVVDSGPYRHIRHPAYTGMILANLGVIIFFFNLIALIICSLILIPAIILRIIIEEKTLFRIDGYVKFAQNRKRLIPGVW